jgi:hypothetical protein
MKKVFKFHAKRGQQQMVADLLRKYGETAMEITDVGGVRVMVILPEGVSKRSVDRMLYAAGVPGAASCKNVPLVKVPACYDLDSVAWEMAEKGYIGKKIKISVKGRRIITGRVTCSTSDYYPGYGYYLD